MYGGGRPATCIRLITNARCDGDCEVDDAEVFANNFVGEIECGGKRRIGTGGRCGLIFTAGSAYNDSWCFEFVRVDGWIICDN